MIKITRRIGLAALVLIGSLQSAAQAQGLFDPVISVNRAAITAYELEQRWKFCSAPLVWPSGRATL